ncbi:hypothetical protein [Nonomuraea roseola]|uniref:Uncharacterized protein n=1 Tax=Nonomuraea roseola TaxID=46179 RepID=A0ABV5PP58_9ACTN
MIVLADCLSPHVAMAKADHMRLAWQQPYPGEGRVRVLSWTCTCRATVYELCQSGGVAYIRRMLQLDGAPEIHETFRWSLSEARTVWAALLSGQAR